MTRQAPPDHSRGLLPSPPARKDWVRAGLRDWVSLWPILGAAALILWRTTW